MKTVERIQIAACWGGWMHWQSHGADPETFEDYFSRGRTVIRVIYDSRGAVHSAHRWNRDKKNVSRLRKHIPNKAQLVLGWLDS